MRRCIATRQHHDDRRLLRFCLNPSGHLRFDVQRRLPGRGAWLIAQQDAWSRTMDRKNKKLWSHAFRRKQITICDDMPKRVDQDLGQACFDDLDVIKSNGQHLCMLESLMQLDAFFPSNTQNCTKYQEMPIKWGWLACDVDQDILQRLESVVGFEYIVVPKCDKTDLGTIFFTPGINGFLFRSGRISERLRAHLGRWRSWRQTDNRRSRIMVRQV